MCGQPTDCQWCLVHSRPLNALSRVAQWRVVVVSEVANEPPSSVLQMYPLSSDIPIRKSRLELRSSLLLHKIKSVLKSQDNCVVWGHTALHNVQTVHQVFRPNTLWVYVTHPLSPVETNPLPENSRARALRRAHTVALHMLWPLIQKYLAN